MKKKRSTRRAAGSKNRSRSTRRAVRGAFLDFTGDPFHEPEESCFRYLEDGLLLVEDGRIVFLQPASRGLSRLPRGTKLDVWRDTLLVPGFIDTHVHFPQTAMIASFGDQLLDWLNKYTYPEEMKFADKRYAARVARFFLGELLRNGTTTAMVFATVHRESVEAFFEQARRLRLRMIAGKVLMDRNAPAGLCDSPKSAYEDSKRLIAKWHGRDRLRYAITPRFAITSSPEQLAQAGRLKAEHPDVYLQTHLSENRREIEEVARLFPERKSYLDVYDHYALLGPRSVFAHAVHVTNEEAARLAETGSAVAFCPISNLFLGSGLFDLEKLKHAKLGMGTDVGGGTSFSMLATLNAAYKVAQLRGQVLSPLKAFYLATLGGAKALSLEDRIGSFGEGKEADFVALDLQATPLLAYRLKGRRALADQLFALLMLGDDRAVKQTYILGEPRL